MPFFFTINKTFATYIFKNILDVFFKIDFESKSTKLLTWLANCIISKAYLIIIHSTYIIYNYTYYKYRVLLYEFSINFFLFHTRQCGINSFLTSQFHDRYALGYKSNCISFFFQKCRKVLVICNFQQ